MAYTLFIISSLLLAWSAISGHISNLKCPLLVKISYKITFHIYLHRLQAAGSKFFISKRLQYLCYKTQPVLGDSARAAVISGISRPIIKEVEFVDSNYISKSFSEIVAMVDGEVFYLFCGVKKPSKLSLIRLIWFMIAEAELNFFCFFIPYFWELLKALLRVFLVFIWLLLIGKDWYKIL